MYKQSCWFPNSQPFSSHAGGSSLAHRRVTTRRPGLTSTPGHTGEGVRHSLHSIRFFCFHATQHPPPFGYFSLGAARCLSNGVITRAPVLETRVGAGTVRRAQRLVAFRLLRTRRDIGVVARRFRKNDAPRRALVSHTRANDLSFPRAFSFTWCCAPWCIRIHVSLCDTMNAIRPCILNPSNYAETFLFSPSSLCSRDSAATLWVLRNDESPRV